nr:hypothetical protein Iba_scaffold7398CG0010 [Ipomoea batatas]
MHISRAKLLDLNPDSPFLHDESAVHKLIPCNGIANKGLPELDSLHCRVPSAMHQSFGSPSLHDAANTQMNGLLQVSKANANAINLSFPIGLTQLPNET